MFKELLDKELKSSDLLLTSKLQDSKSYPIQILLVEPGTLTSEKLNFFQQSALLNNTKIYGWVYLDPLLKI